MNDSLDLFSFESEGSVQEVFEVSNRNTGSTTAVATLVPPPPPQQQPPSSSYRQPPAKDHPYFETLKSRTGPNKDKKLEVLNRIASDETAMNFLGFDENSRDQMKSMKRSNVLEDISRALCQVIGKLESKSDSDMENAPRGVVLFKEFVDKDVKKAYANFNEIQKQKARTGSRGKKIGAQPPGQLIQEAAEYEYENMMEGGIDVAMGRLSTRLCPGCQHSFLVVHGKTKEEINKENDTKKTAWEAEMKEYKRRTKSASKRQKESILKPKNPKYDTVMYACLCCVQNCVSRLDGTGCLQCKQATDIKRHADNDPKSINPNIDTTSCSCTCDICNCTCSIFFKGDDFAKIATQSQLVKEQGEASAANDRKSKYLLH